MQPFKAILIDDEEGARNVLTQLLERFCPNIDILYKYSNLLDAIEGIKKLKPEIVFLDIEMPNYAGYEIVDFFDEIDFEIIFITAYDKYAIKAFEVAAVDYLLKPIDVEKLKKSIQKVVNQLQLKKESENYKILSQTLETNTIERIVINDKGYQKTINVDTIIAIQAQESYCYIHTLEEKYIVSKNLKHFENIFSDSKKITRIHKSWMINTIHVLSYSKSKLELQLQNEIIAKLSKYRKAEFEQFIT